MNHIYHSIWNESLGTWVAVSEITTGQGKQHSSKHNKKLNLIFSSLLILCTTNAFALPTGEQLVSGQATVATPAANQMQINQASQKAIINWQGFSVGQHESVNIQQPNANAALLNRVVGQNASQIHGKINANGQVYLVNPNGVIFSKTAQIDVGGLVATTHNIKDQDFINGNHHFTQNGAAGKVENHGTINTPNSGVVALIGEQVTNTGNINTPKGTTALAAGKTVDLDFKGDGLVEVKVTEAALNAQINNQGVIQADGGRVVMSAKAANSLIDTVINQQGIVKAQGLIERNGEIILDGGDNGAVKVSGTLDTSNTNQGLNSNNGSPNLVFNASTTGGNITVKGAAIQLVNGANINASGKTGGGTITIGDKQITQKTTIEQGATVSAQTLDSGKAGTINVLASMDNGLVKVDGLLDASAPNNGDGGFIDTSAAHVKVADTAKISTKANNGNTGRWLIDPTNYTIAASGGDITGANLASYLGASNVEIQTLATGSTGLGDIFVNDAVTWNNFNQLILTAHRNVNVNAAINALGGGSVRLRADSLGTGTGTVTFTGNGHVTVNNGAAVGIHYNPVSYTDVTTKSDSTGNPYSSKVTLNSGSTLSAFMLVNDVNKLQAMNTNLSGNYALGKDIDASATVGWNGGAGFIPVGTGGWQQSGSLAFRGKVDGLNHTISNLYINRPTQDDIALFGTVFNPAVISNVGLVGGSIRGQSSVGSLIGWNENGKVINSYATTEIFGIVTVGGLMGVNSWTGLISNSYATGNVTGSGVGVSVGGLAGHNQGVISNSFATGRVSGGREVGGLVGNNHTNSGRITNSYATGSVSGTTNVGGLVGLNTSATNVSNYWDTQTSGRATSASGTGKTTAQMKQQASFSGWDFTNTWQINEGVSYPTLQVSNTQPAASIITPIVVTTNPNSTPIIPVTPTPPIIDVSGNPKSIPLPDKSPNTDVNGNADLIVEPFIGPKQNIEPPNSGLFLVTDDNMGGKGPLVPPCQFSSCQSTQPIILNEQNSSNTSSPPLDTYLKDIKIGEVSLYEYAQSKMEVIKARDKLQSLLEIADKVTMYDDYKNDPAVERIMRNYNTQAANYSSQLGKTYVGYGQYIDGLFSHLGDGVKNAVTGEIVLLKGLKAELDIAIQLRTEGLKKAKEFLDMIKKAEKLQATKEVAESVEVITKVTELLLSGAEKGKDGSKEDYADMALKLVELINSDKKLAEKIKVTDLALKIKKLSGIALDYQKKTNAISAIPEMAGITLEEKARFQEALDSEVKNATDDVTKSLFSFLPLPDSLKSGTEFGKAFFDSFSKIDDVNDNRELLSSVQRNNNTANALHNWSNLVSKTENDVFAALNSVVLKSE